MHGVSERSLIPSYKAVRFHYFLAIYQNIEDEHQSYYLTVYCLKIDISQQSALITGLVFSLFHQAVRESVQASADDSVLKCLIDLADTCPKLLRANLEQILDLMLEVCFTEHLLNLFCQCVRSWSNFQTLGSGSRSLEFKPCHHVLVWASQFFLTVPFSAQCSDSVGMKLILS